MTELTKAQLEALLEMTKMYVTSSGLSQRYIEMIFIAELQNTLVKIIAEMEKAD